MKYALQRRGLAMEMAGILNYDAHEKWSDLLFEHRLQACPPGYRSVTISQLIQADKALFGKLNDTVRGGIAPNIAGEKPLEAVFETCRQKRQGWQGRRLLEWSPP